VLAAGKVRGDHVPASRFSPSKPSRLSCWKHDSTNDCARGRDSRSSGARYPSATVVDAERCRRRASAALAKTPLACDASLEGGGRLLGAASVGLTGICSRPGVTAQRSKFAGRPVLRICSLRPGNVSRSEDRGGCVRRRLEPVGGTHRCKSRAHRAALSEQWGGVRRGRSGILGEGSVDTPTAAKRRPAPRLRQLVPRPGAYRDRKRRRRASGDGHAATSAPSIAIAAPIQIR
jgi:hypothetical protein